MQTEVKKAEAPKSAANVPDIVLEPLEEDSEQKLERAGGTTEQAKAAGSKGYVDKELHAGFVSKQTGLGH